MHDWLLNSLLTTGKAYETKIAAYKVWREREKTVKNGHLVGNRRTEGRKGELKIVRAISQIGWNLEEQAMKGRRKNRALNVYLVSLYIGLL